jgi:DNA-binding transcriptional regulator YiaG
MIQHPRTAETYWKAIGWQAQADAFAPVREKRQKQAEANERRAAASEHSVVGRGERLAAMRQKVGLNARQLSRIVGVLPSDVTEWERNLRPIPNSVVPAIERACKDTLVPAWQAA